MKKHTRAIAAAALAVAAITLSGCSSSSTPEPTVTVTEYAEDTSMMSPEDMYLESLYSNGDPRIDNMDRSSLLSLGRQSCEILDAGFTVEEMVIYFVTEGNFSDAEYRTIGSIIGAAVYNLCPEYEYQVDDFTGGY